MSYHGHLGVSPGPITTSKAAVTMPSYSASSPPSVDAWRAPYIAAADRFLLAVRAAFRKMPEWGQGRHFSGVAESWFTAARRETLDQLKLRAGILRLTKISPVSMPATRYGATAERDAVLKAQDDLLALFPMSSASVPTQTSPPPVVFLPAPAPTTTAPPPPSAPVPSQPVPDVECADGYFRDASGLCVPPAPAPSAPPAPAPFEPPPLVTTPSIDTSVIAESTPPLPSLMPSERRWFGVPAKTWVIGLGVTGATIIAFTLLSSPSKVEPNRRRRRMRRNLATTRAGRRVHGEGRGLGTVAEVHGENVLVNWDSGRRNWVDRSILEHV